MKHLIQRILGAVALTAGALAAPVAFAGDVGVSISVGQPGFYGRIDVGNVRPDVVYAQPMMIERVYAPAPPLYLRVPPGHYRSWARHCGYYRGLRPAGVFRAGGLVLPRLCAGVLRPPACASDAGVRATPAAVGSAAPRPLGRPPRLARPS
ncbi:hypothetical protein ACFJIX_02595 [Roseateles sp. UC29_93]|uniref:hypothetical protein n=1 Tax=Roseateles sp. UC29_93 TaxID=3350177 RepID=UPI00366D610D